MLQQSGQLNSPMVAEEVPPVTWLAQRTCCHRVGVKRSREQANRLIAGTVQVRPALEADPAEGVRAPIMDTEGRGADSPTKPSSCPSRLPARPPFLMRAAVGEATVPIDVVDEVVYGLSRRAEDPPATPTATQLPIHGLLS